MVDVEKEKIKGEEVHEEIQRIRYETDLNPPIGTRSFAIGVCFTLNRCRGIGLESIKNISC